MNIIPFSKLNMSSIAEVGGKNASLGEMYNKLKPLGINIPDGFAVTSKAYRQFLEENKLVDKLEELLNSIDHKTLDNLAEISKKCRDLVKKAAIPADVKKDIIEAYHKMGKSSSVAVRSSATAEDLPTASFAGQHDSFLNVTGDKSLLEAVHKCYISVFNDRVIKYRIDNKFDHMKVSLSAGVQQMVRSDKGAAGVIFTLDPESGFKNVIYITGSWGLGENVVQGAVNPDEFWIFKETLTKNKQAIINRKKGTKEHTMVYNHAKGARSPIINTETPANKRVEWILSDKEIMKLAKWSLDIEKHYKLPMDIEWAKDGITGEMYIVQARPETVHAQKERNKVYDYKLTGEGEVLCTGKSIGRKIVTGRACIIHSLKEASKLKQGDILVAEITNPDWNALLKKAVSIVTNKGGRTSHASIVARELGISAIVGTGNATRVIKDGQIITVACTSGDEGQVYDGEIPFKMTETNLKNIPATKTKPMFILADPERAFELAQLPAQGVGLLRMEFIINNNICIHPMALVKYKDLPAGHDKTTIATLTSGFNNKSEYFIHHLSEAIGQVAAAFYPREVIVRMSDFKSNEYASLIGGNLIEPHEENPMLGFRGASRYYDDRYKDGFKLECQAIQRVRNEMGLENVKVMIPFCRTPKEGKKVLETMKANGLKQGDNGLEVYMMVEIPANVILADQFAKIFDGFSIGSNDLTQLTLGIDRDSEIVSDLFDENNEAVTEMISRAIKAAKKAKIKIGLCGQAPSDFPEFSKFLVEHGIDTISFAPDSLFRGIKNIAKAEKLKARK